MSSLRSGPVPSFEPADLAPELIDQGDEHDPGPEPEEPEREWVYVFGHGQTFASVSPSGQVSAGAGIPAHGFFVTLIGTYDSTTAEMRRLFGEVWSTVYPTREAAGVDTYQMRELYRGRAR